MLEKKISKNITLKKADQLFSFKPNSFLVKNFKLKIVCKITKYVNKC